MISEFVTLYNSTWGMQPFSDLTELAAGLGWTATINQSTMAYFDAQGINARWTREMVEAATRVNYGQVCFLNLTWLAGQRRTDRSPRMLMKFTPSRECAPLQLQRRRLSKVVTGESSNNSSRGLMQHSTSILRYAQSHSPFLSF